MSDKINNPKEPNSKTENKDKSKRYIILSILFSLVLISVLVVSFKTKFNYGSKLIFGNSQLFYTKSVTELDAKSLGNYLTKIGYFGDDKVSMQLSKHTDVYDIGVVLTEDYDVTEDFKKKYRNLALELSDNVFNKEKVNINICNKYFRVKNTISYDDSSDRMGQRLFFNEGSLYYTSPVEKDYANALGKYLIEEEFFDDSEQTAQINKVNNSYILKVIVSDYYMPTEEDITLTKLFAAELSDNVFNGNRLDIALCNQFFEPISIISYDKNTPHFGLKIRFGYDEIYYNAPVDKTEAIALGKFLLEEDFFKNEGTPVQINKINSDYELRIIPNDNLKIDSKYESLIKTFAFKLSENVFNGNKVYVVLCDDFFKEKQRITYDTTQETT